MEAERPSWFHDYAKDEEDGHRISELSAHIHAATAELALLLADYDESEAWAGGSGFRSVAHWMSQETGFDLSTAHELLKVGQAMKRLPLLAKAFRSGELSLDKARAIARVAEPGKRRDVGRTGETDGRGAADSGSARIPASDGSRLGRASRTPPDRRGVWFNWLDDGMLKLVALLPPEQGALVQKAIEAVTGGKPAADLGVDGWEAGRADALVAVCDHALASAPDDLISDSGSRQVLVHVDAGVLTGQDPEGRCHLESGPALSTATALKLGCDAELVTVIEKDGLPVDVGRKRRAISTRMRMALRSRDGSCRFPGCTVPARRTQGHHLEHWAHGGRTTLGNLLSLCEFHHHRLHEGAFQIKREGAKLHFLTRDGRALGPPGPGRVGSSCGGKAHLMHVAQMRRKDIDWRTPIAKDGSKVDHELTVWVLCTNTEHYRRQLASRDGPAQQPG